MPGHAAQATQQRPAAPGHWHEAVHSHSLGEGVQVHCLDLCARARWSFCSQGAAALSVGILLEGRMQTAFDEGPVVDVQPGSALVMSTSAHASGWDVLDGKTHQAFRLVNIRVAQAAIASLTGLQAPQVRERIRARNGQQAHRDAFLGAMPASASLQRAASELLGLGRAQANAGACHALFIRAKAFETLGLFLREHLTEQPPLLPVPADRARLLEAHGLLRQGYEQAWTVPLLAHAVGLNEKRLQAGFQALFGQSVHACLTRIRIDAAMGLLGRGASVTETALAVGFSSLSHFSLVFRSCVGIAPKQYALGMPAVMQTACTKKASRPGP